MAHSIDRNVAPAVLFADIAGSTALYEGLGDQAAKSLIDECLRAMREVIARYDGRVVKTIGDELMCVFPDAERGALAATDMQTAVSALPEAPEVKRAIRIGFNAGAVIEAEGDVFGDTVNTAARMAALAKADQIITTSATVERLSPLMRQNTRRIAALAIKGKGDEIEVCEVLWQSGDDLTMATASILPVSAPVRLALSVRGTRRLVLDGARGQAMLGRDPTSDLVLADRKASRVHARIERRRDKFFLIDQSTNGTFVTFEAEAEIVLRREEVMLRGSGRIAFGHSLAESDEEAVEFVLR